MLSVLAALAIAQILVLWRLELNMLRVMSPLRVAVLTATDFLPPLARRITNCRTTFKSYEDFFPKKMRKKI